MKNYFIRHFQLAWLFITILSSPSYVSSQFNTDATILGSSTTCRSEVSVAVSPLDRSVVLVSANANQYIFPNEFYGTGVYWTTDAGTSWSGMDSPPQSVRLGIPILRVTLGTGASFESRRSQTHLMAL